MFKCSLKELWLWVDPARSSPFSGSFFLIQRLGWIKMISFLFLLIKPCFPGDTSLQWQCGAGSVPLTSSPGCVWPAGLSSKIPPGIWWKDWNWPALCQLSLPPNWDWLPLLPLPTEAPLWQLFLPGKFRVTAHFSPASIGRRVVEGIGLERTLKIIWLQHFGHRMEVIVQLLLEIILKSIDICRLTGGMRLRASSSWRQQHNSSYQTALPETDSVKLPIECKTHRESFLCRSWPGAKSLDCWVWGFFQLFP